ncbi:uncharacterized protein ACRADG_003222 [Cochliomyia hominivorax]
MEQFNRKSITMKLVAGSIILPLIISNFYTDTLALNISRWKLRNYDSKRSIDAAVTAYYERRTFMMSIGVNLEYSKNWQNYIMDFLTAALTHSKLMKYEIFMKSNKQIQNVTKVSYHNLWYVDSYKGFRSLLTATKNDFNENMGKYFIVMEIAQMLNPKREVQLILEKSFQLNIVDIVVAVYIKAGTFKIYSYEIFRPHRCRQVIVEQVNLFSHGRFKNNDLFPYKFKNFHNCPITMYIRNTSLFFRFNLSEDGTQIKSIEGVEANMIRVMAQKLNFKLHMFYKPINVSGQVFPNGTAVGPFSFLSEGKLDILLGYYHETIRSRYFGESTSYAFMPLVMVISEHNSREFVGIWLIKPFSGRTWLIFFLLSLLVVVLVQLAHCYLSKTVTWIDILGLVLGNSRPLHIKSYITKISFSVCIFGTMVLCATFQGRLYNAFNSGPETKIIDIQQLIDANYTFFIRRSFDHNLVNSLHIPVQQIRYFDVADDYSIYKEMRNYIRNVATLTNYWDFQMYMESNKCYSEFDIVPMIVILNQICAYMRNHSYLIEPFNRMISSLNVAGILSKWMQNMTDINKTNEIELSVKHNLSMVPQPLTVLKLRIVFVGLMFLYIISILTFFGELMVKYCRGFFKKGLRIKNLRKFYRKFK